MIVPPIIPYEPSPVQCFVLWCALYLLWVVICGVLGGITAARAISGKWWWQK